MTAGLHGAKILATNDLDEHRIAELVNGDAPIDAFGVGTALATSSDAPSISAVYKMVELKKGGNVQYTAKFSGEKSTRPGSKQIYRLKGHDILALQAECSNDFGSSPLVRPSLHDGELVEREPNIMDVRSYARKHIGALPAELLELRVRALSCRSERPVGRADRESS